VNDHDPSPLYYEFEAEVSVFDADGYRVNEEAADRYVAESRSSRNDDRTSRDLFVRRTRRDPLDRSRPAVSPT
jgi:hypothetical protein